MTSCNLAEAITDAMASPAFCMPAEIAHLLDVQIIRTAAIHATLKQENNNTRAAMLEPAEPAPAAAEMPPAETIDKKPARPLRKKKSSLASSDWSKRL